MDPTKHATLRPLPPGSDLLEHDHLSVRAVNALSLAGYLRLADVAGFTDEELRSLPAIGVTTVAEIRAALEEAGLARGRYPAARARLEESGGDPGRIRVLDLGMTFRTTNPMVGAGIETVEQAESRTDRELLGLRQFGTRSLHEYRSTLADALQELLGATRARKVLERWADARDARS